KLRVIAELLPGYNLRRLAHSRLHGDLAPNALGELWLECYAWRGHPVLTISEVQPGSHYRHIVHQTANSAELDLWRRSVIERVAQAASAEGMLVFGCAPEVA